MSNLILGSIGIAVCIALFCGMQRFFDWRERVAVRRMRREARENGHDERLVLDFLSGEDRS